MHLRLDLANFKIPNALSPEKSKFFGIMKPSLAMRYNRYIMFKHKFIG